MKRSNATSERLFRAAGLSEGMHVLELGCGPGEVTELLSEIVGPSGRVLAVDRSEEMLARAREKLQQAGRQNVRCLRAELNEDPDYLADVDHGAFDAVAGRRVLMYLEDPARVLAGLLPWLREGGLAVFEESDSTICPGYVAAMPAHARGFSLLSQMLDQEGVDQSVGFRLPALFSKAGLRFERVWAEAVIDGQGDQYTIGELLQLLEARLEATGVATASEIAALVAEIADEREPANVFVSGMRFCAKATKRNECAVAASVVNA